MKKVLIILGVIVSVILLFIGIFVSTNNRTIVLEEQINESKSSIKVQEKRRIDLLINLVDTAKSYNNYEQETMAKIIEARQKATGGQIEEVKTLISAVAEQYPELKSNENYKQVMTEMSVTENLIAEYRNNYNEQIKNYKKYIRRFPHNIVLSITGYEKIDTDYLDYDVSEDAPTNLWK